MSILDFFLLDLYKICHECMYKEWIDSHKMFSKWTGAFSSNGPLLINKGKCIPEAIS